MTLSPAERELGKHQTAERELGKHQTAERELGKIQTAEREHGKLQTAELTLVRPGDAERQLDKLRDAMVQAHLALHDGVAVDLFGLDDAVYQAMEAAQAAPDAERPSIIAAMVTLIDELDRVAIAIHQQYQGSHQQRAAAAYREPRRVAAG